MEDKEMLMMLQMVTTRVFSYFALYDQADDDD